MEILLLLRRRYLLHHLRRKDPAGLFDTPELHGRYTNPVQARTARDHLRQKAAGHFVGIPPTPVTVMAATFNLFNDGLPIGAEMARCGHGVVMNSYTNQCDWNR